MTRHKHAQTGLVTPQLPQLLLTAVLRAFAMLVLHVASTLQMIRRREPVNATQPMPTDLPQAKTDTQPKETNAVPHDSPIALILSSTRSVRPSKDEGVLTACHPGNAKRYPGPIVRARHTINGSRLSLRSAGMTTIGETESAQHARSYINTPLSLRVRRFASNPRRKSGPRGGLFRYALLWFPACAGASGDLITAPNKNAPT
jgi:hypothetical protein